MPEELTIELREQKITANKLYHVIGTDGATLGSWSTYQGAMKYKEHLEMYCVTDAKTFKEFTGVDVNENK